MAYVLVSHYTFLSPKYTLVFVWGCTQILSQDYCVCIVRAPPDFCNYAFMHIDLILQ